MKVKLICCSVLAIALAPQALFCVPLDFVTNWTSAQTLNNFTGWLGLNFTVGETPMTVSAIGRACIAGNSGVHSLKLVRQSDGSDIADSIVSVSLDQCTPGQFVYASLANPVTLDPRNSYYLLSQEVSGGDLWYAPNAVVSSGFAVLNGPAYSDGQGKLIPVDAPGESTVPVSMQFTTPDVLVSNDFETDPTPYWGTISRTGQSAWTTEDAYSGTHSLKIGDGLWYTPELDTDPFTFYQISFKAKVPVDGVYGPLANPNTRYVNTGKWETNSAIFRSELSQSTTRYVFGVTGYLPAYIDDVIVKRISDADAAVQLSQTYAQYPNTTTPLDPNRLSFIPNTIQKLQAGSTVRVLMLGDSIVNDSADSYFEPVVEQMYPGSPIQLISSFRNGTGVWYYNDPTQLQGYVFSYSPDLVIIGGISNQNDIDSMRQVVDAVKAFGAEVILMTPLGGPENDPFVHPEILQPLDPTSTTWNANLFNLAVSEQVGFLDMTQPWGDIINQSGLPYYWFLRDPIHMSNAGMAVAGKILVRYFTPPPVAPAASVSLGVDGTAYPIRTKLR